MNIDETLNERGARYGEFAGHAAVSQRLKEMARFELSYRDKRLADDQKEALDMIFHKIARIINGDPDYADSWVDIAGYATLVANRLETKKWTSEKPQDAEKRMGSLSAFPPLF
jgi:hypothetical protein